MTDALTPVEGGPSPLLPVDARNVVYRALIVERASVAQIAAQLSISKQAVHEHVRALERVGAVRRVSRKGARLKVERGPRAASFERASEVRQGTAGSGLPIRAHHWRWSRGFTSGPSVEPPWTWRGEASGVPSFSLELEEGGLGWTVREYRGKTRRSLQVVPPPVVVDSGEDVLAAEARMASRALAVVEGFADRYGYLLVGSLRVGHAPPSSATEYAGPRVPGLAPFGRPGVDRVWADRSQGDGDAEIETRDAPLAAAWADLPRFERETRAAIEELRGAVARVAALQAEGFQVTASQARLQRREGSVP